MILFLKYSKNFVQNKKNDLKIVNLKDLMSPFLRNAIFLFNFNQSSLLLVGVPGTNKQDVIIILRGGGE